MLPILRNVRFPSLDFEKREIIVEDVIGDVYDGIVNVKNNIGNVVVSVVDGIADIKEKLCDGFNLNLELEDEENCFGGLLDNNIFKF